MFTNSYISYNFRFVLPHLKMLSGAISIASKQFKQVNGMSNEYFGWSGENENFYARLEACNIKITRFEPKTSLYYMFSQLNTQRNV